MILIDCKLQLAKTYFQTLCNSTPLAEITREMPYGLTHMVIHSHMVPGQPWAELPLQLIQLLLHDPGEPSPSFENPGSGIDLKQLQPKRLSTEDIRHFQSLGIAVQKKKKG